MHKSLNQFILSLLQVNQVGRDFIMSSTGGDVGEEACGELGEVVDGAWL